MYRKLLCQWQKNMKNQNKLRKQPTNWDKLGKVLQWALNELKGNELNIYLVIARKTIGYGQATNDFISYADIKQLTQISLSTISRNMPRLIERGFIIKVPTNQIANIGKVAYKYQLNFKLKDFPSLGTLKTSREVEKPIAEYKEVKPVVELTTEILSDKILEDYIQIAGRIIPYQECKMNEVNALRQIRSNNECIPDKEIFEKWYLKDKPNVKIEWKIVKEDEDDLLF